MEDLKNKQNDGQWLDKRGRPVSRKLLLFVGSFMISFLAIYSSYYYNKVSGKQEVVVADLGLWPKTAMNSLGPQITGWDTLQNAIFHNGLATVAELPLKAELDSIPNGWLLGMNASATPANIEKLSEEVIRKFTNHPPMSFPGTTDKDNVLFSYFVFRNELSRLFRPSTAKCVIGAKEVSSIEYYPHNAKHEIPNLKYYRNGTNSVTVISLDSLHEGLWYGISLPGNSGAFPSYASLKMVLDSLESEANLVKIAKSEALVIPRIDMSLVKVHNPKDWNGKYKRVEDRIKMKISGVDDVDPQLHVEGFRFHKVEGKCFVFLIRRKGSNEKPVLLLYTTDGRILVRG